MLNSDGRRRGMRNLRTTPAAVSWVLAVTLHLATASACTDAANVSLAAHNVARAYFSVPPLVYDAGLAQAALALATDRAAHGCSLMTSSLPFGENWAGATGATAGSPAPDECTAMAAAVTQWMAENATYTYTATPYADNWLMGKVVGHFTQVVWRSTSAVGCGSATGGGGTCRVTTCLYAPAGNVATDADFADNVLPPPGVNTTTPGGCKDNLDACESWAAAGYCQTGYTFNDQPVNTVLCPASCGACAQPLGRRFLRSVAGMMTKRLQSAYVDPVMQVAGAEKPVRHTVGQPKRQGVVDGKPGGPVGHRPLRVQAGSRVVVRPRKAGLA